VRILSLWRDRRTRTSLKFSPLGLAKSHLFVVPTSELIESRRPVASSGLR
jgi:hypothetical protein